MLTHGNMTIYTMLIKQAHKDANKPFIIYENEEFSYETMLQKVNQTAHWLVHKGIKKGDTIGVFLYNSPTFYELWFACGAIGAVLLPINTASTPIELEYFLEHSDSKGFIYEKDLINEKHKNIISINQLLFTQACSSEWENEKLKQSNKNISNFVQANDTACIMYTSGTTAKPKGVLITHENYLFAGHSSALYQQLNKSDRYLIFLPLFHANSQYYTSMATLVVGGTIILLKHFSASSFWDAVKKYKPTVTSLVATIIKILNETPTHPDENNHSIRQAGYGLFITKSDMELFKKRFGIHLFQWYGLTETITVNVTVPLYEEMPVDPETGILSIGKAALGQEIKIINDNGNSLPPGKVGEIIVKSPSLMKGYYKNKKETDKALQDGWFHTGDYGYYNEEGFIWFVDRDNDMIKRAGENISSIEVENVIADHIDVEDCAVIGVPDKLREKAVIAYVKTHNNNIIEDELRAHCEMHLSYFKVPEEFHFVNDFPRTSIGKIQKNKLRDTYQKKN